MELDPNDPFESLLIPIVEMNRRKRADYASEDNIYKNFDYVSAATMGMVTPREYCDIQVIMKTGRIQNLRGKDPTNEGVLDTYLDRAVYSILAYGLILREGPQPGAIGIKTETTKGVAPPNDLAEWCDDPDHQPGCVVVHDRDGTHHEIREMLVRE